MSHTTTIETQAEGIDAAHLFRIAYENRYTWDANFPGFTASARLIQDGHTYQAEICVSSNLKITIVNASSPEAEKAIGEQLQEIIIHRVHRSFADVHGKNEFTYGGVDESGEVLVLVGGAATGDRYKVHNNIVSMVHRHIHGMVVTIHVFSTFDTGKGYLPVDYESFYTNPNKAESNSPIQRHHDEYAPFGDYFILKARQVRSDDPSQTKDFQLTEITLLNGSDKSV